MTDTSSITLWLAVIGVASLIQVTLLIVVAVAGLLAYRRATDALNALHRETLEPVVQRVTTALEDVHDVAGRVRAADAQLRGAMSKTADRAGQAAWLVSAKLWPVLGVARGVWAAVDSLRDRRGRHPVPPRGPRAVRPA